MKLIDLFEYRRGSNDGRETALEKLKKYKDDPDVYISFTKIPKLGINPQSKFDTPIGIYCYPLQAAWTRYGVKNGIDRFPFASENPYIWVFKGRLRDVSEITSEEVDKAVSYALDHGAYQKEIDVWIKTAKSQENFGKFWNITRLFAHHTGTGNPAVKWTKIFLDLGYNGFSDKGAEGIIHPAEPVQAVFFTTKGIQILERIDNFKETTIDRFLYKLRKNPEIIKRYLNRPQILQKIFKLNRDSFIKIKYSPEEQQLLFANAKNVINVYPEIITDEKLIFKIIRDNPHPNNNVKLAMKITDENLLKELSKYASDMYKGIRQLYKIYKNPADACEFADIRGRRWPMAEPYIMKDPTQAYLYAKNVMWSRWEEAEPYIKQDKEAWEAYQEMLAEMKGDK